MLTEFRKDRHCLLHFSGHGATTLFLLFLFACLRRLTNRLIIFFKYCEHINSEFEE
jgi:hypothetical protein